MYKDNQRENQERYERKLQLVQAVRAENQANQQRIQHRNHLFYNIETENPSNEINENINQNPSLQIPSKGRSYFGLRVCISAFCVLSFWCLKQGKIQEVAGIGTKEIKACVAQDFSKVVVDYIKNLTYTLNYEKTSIK